MHVNIFHSWGSTGQSHWYPWLAGQLIQRGHNVWVPDLPDTNRPELAKWLPFVLQHGTYDKDTVLIGHSSGTPLILSVLENLSAPIAKAILVSAFHRPIEAVSATEPPILQASYNWEKIKQNCKEFIIINSDTDPFGCTPTVGLELLENIGGTLVVPHAQGHFGATNPAQNYTQFPLLLSYFEA